MIALFASAFVTFLLVIDPPGCAPIFAGLTRGAAAAHRRSMAVRAVLVASAILLFFALFGEDLLRALVIALCVVSAASVAWARWDARARDPWLHAYQRVQRACRRAGWTVPEHLPPLGLARLIAAHASASTQATASRLAQALVELDELRYGAHADGDTRRQLRECRRRLIALTKGLHYEG